MLGLGVRGMGPAGAVSGIDGGDGRATPRAGPPPWSLGAEAHTNTWLTPQKQRQHFTIFSFDVFRNSVLMVLHFLAAIAGDAGSVFSEHTIFQAASNCER